MKTSGYAIVDTERCEIGFALTGAEDVQTKTPSSNTCEGSDGSGENLLFRYDGNDGVKLETSQTHGVRSTIRRFKPNLLWTNK